MSENEVKGQFHYDRDSKRFHRFLIETDEGIVGSVYIPKYRDGMPKKLILDYKNETE